LINAKRKLHKNKQLSIDAPLEIGSKNDKSAAVISDLKDPAKTQETNVTGTTWCIDFLCPGVSIIKPLVGVDMNLLDNLETVSVIIIQQNFQISKQASKFQINLKHNLTSSIHIPPIATQFFNMGYPVYELLFCVQDVTDPAIELVYKLMSKYPHANTKLFISFNCFVIIYDNLTKQQTFKAVCGEKRGVNPKINNMLPAYEASRYELILISDSGIRMKKNTLSDMIYHMKDDIALVHQMPFIDWNTVSSLVEKVYFGTAHARAYLSADLLGINCSTGMSALMRKFLIDEVGGLGAFGEYLAEDYFFAKSFTDRGWKLSISSQPAWQNAAPLTTDSNRWSHTVQFYQRISRWIKLRLAMVPFLTFIEPLTECMALGLLAAPSVSFVINTILHAHIVHPATLYIGHILVWLIFDYILMIVVQNGPVRFSKLEFLFAWLIRECSALIVFIDAIRDQNICWRSRVFRLKWGGKAYEIPPAKLAPS
ncbi:Ceramide glucosyltransferase-B, partial [Fragariocoptes setiger]